MNEIEAIGDMAQGGLVARAVEPPAGENAAGTDGHTLESTCLNCGTPLIGSHCHSCGQRGHVHKTLGAFFHDLLHGVLHFEGKIWRTLPMLVWRPGQLTREYIDGRRASYVSPIALFLFVVFVSFALFNALGGSDSIRTEVEGVERLRSAYEVNEIQLERLRSERARLADDAPEVDAVDRQISEVRADQEAMRMVLGSVSSEFQREFEAGFERTPLPEGNRLTAELEKIRSNPQLAIYKAQTNAYKYSWILIPLSVPFVWLLFPFSRQFRGYDHTVFTTYSISFMIALVAVVSLLWFYRVASIGVVLSLYAPWHLYRQLRGTYALSRWGAIWRLLVLSLFIWMAIGLFVAAIGLMTA